VRDTARCCIGTDAFSDSKEAHATDQHGTLRPSIVTSIAATLSAGEAESGRNVGFCRRKRAKKMAWHAIDHAPGARAAYVWPRKERIFG
jgi:hypothetical protein